MLANKICVVQYISQSGDAKGLLLGQEKLKIISACDTGVNKRAWLACLIISAEYIPAPSYGMLSVSKLGHYG